jgi:hypothetical protein
MSRYVDSTRKGTADVLLSPKVSVSHELLSAETTLPPTDTLPWAVPALQVFASCASHNGPRSSEH